MGLPAISIQADESDKVGADPRGLPITTDLHSLDLLEASTVPQRASYHAFTDLCQTWGLLLMGQAPRQARRMVPCVTHPVSHPLPCCRCLFGGRSTWRPPPWAQPLLPASPQASGARSGSWAAFRMSSAIATQQTSCPRCALTRTGHRLSATWQLSGTVRLAGGSVYGTPCGVHGRHYWGGHPQGAT